MPISAYLGTELSFAWGGPKGIMAAQKLGLSVYGDNAAVFQSDFKHPFQR